MAVMVAVRLTRMLEVNGTVRFEASSRFETGIFQRGRRLNANQA